MDSKTIALDEAMMCDGVSAIETRLKMKISEVMTILKNPEVWETLEEETRKEVANLEKNPGEVQADKLGLLATMFRFAKQHNEHKESMQEALARAKEAEEVANKSSQQLEEAT